MSDVEICYRRLLRRRVSLLMRTASQSIVFAYKTSDEHSKASSHLSASSMSHHQSAHWHHHHLIVIELRRVFSCVFVVTTVLSDTSCQAVHDPLPRFVAAPSHITYHRQFSFTHTRAWCVWINISARERCRLRFAGWFTKMTNVKCDVYSRLALTFFTTTTAITTNITSPCPVRDVQWAISPATDPLLYVAAVAGGAFMMIIINTDVALNAGRSFNTA